MDIRSVHATIPELDLIDKIEALSNDYEERHGRAPINVSHWDPSQEIVRKLRAALPISVEQNPIPYNFSYFLDSHPEVRFKLGIRADASSLFLENGSSAILLSLTCWRALACRRSLSCGLVTSQFPMH
jgi:hypothetical protein